MLTRPAIERESILASGIPSKIETKINPAFERDFYWINPQSVVIPKGKLK